MKSSYYNTITKVDQYFIFFNSFSGSYLIVSSKQYNIYEQYSNSIDIIKNIDPDFFDILKKNGFIVNSNIDEHSQHAYLRLKRKFTNNIYHIIINPTLNCNLSCWYCYENHIDSSEISDELLTSLIKNIEVKYTNEPFKQLIITFFGGEPLIKTKKTISVIDYLKSFTKKRDIALIVDFTTNGTIITNEFLNSLKDCQSSFQITLDGSQFIHDEVRFFKASKSGSYQTILQNIEKIQNELKSVKIIIRINYNTKTLNYIENILDDLSFMDKKKCSISLHRIWQVEKESINSDDIIRTLELIMSRGYIVDYSPLAFTDYKCYADNNNQLLLNYNGDIFKCTSKDFTKENSCGKLLSDGLIEFDFKHINKRLSVQLPENCLKCTLLPSCCGQCSQNLLDGDTMCYLDDIEISFEDYIVYNFKRAILEDKIKQMA